MATFNEKSLGKSSPLEIYHLGFLVVSTVKPIVFPGFRPAPHELSGQQQVTEKLQGLEYFGRDHLMRYLQQPSILITDGKG